MHVLQNHAPARPSYRVAVWYWKGGVGKSTTTIMFSLLAARKGQRVLTVDVDPECGTSRDFLGHAVRGLGRSIRTYLHSDAPEPPPVIHSGVENIDLLPSSPNDIRSFRHFTECSTKLRDGLDLLPAAYDWVFIDVPHQFDNLAQLGLIAADFVILPIELTLDALDRLSTVLEIIEQSRTKNPGLIVLGALPLASLPRSRQELSLVASERLIYRGYEETLGRVDIPIFRTMMFLSAKSSVALARGAADFDKLHHAVKPRFTRLFAEVVARIRFVSNGSSPCVYD
jgi:cellulose biosynthesis protein BcsQ